MTKQVLIVESDSASATNMRSELESRGFHVETTADGKGSIELIRSKRPALVVLAVELAAGQNGYILCGKLKKDDEVKQIPVVIVGPPEGFAQHKKLKTRADEYEGKPLTPGALAEKVGTLIGFPEVEVPAADDSDDELVSFAEDAEEVSIDTDSDHDSRSELHAEPPAQESESELEMFDAAFDGITDAPPPPPVAEHDAAPVADDFVDSALTDEDQEQQTVIGYSVSEGLASSNGDTAIRSRIAELERALAEAEARSSELETQLAARPVAASSGGKNESKELIALKDAANKKDKEILRLRNEQNQKEQEVLDLKDREVALEGQVAELSEQLAEKDATVKAAQQKADQATSEKRKLEAQLKEKASAAESSRSELEELRARVTELETERDAARYEADEARNTTESQAKAFADEVSGLRQKLTELERSAQTDGARAAKLLSQLSEDEKRREKAREALTLALQLLEEQPATAQAHVPDAEEDLDLSVQS